MRFFGLLVFLLMLAANQSAMAAQALVKYLNYSGYAEKNLLDGQFDRTIYNDAKSLARFGDRRAQYVVGAMLQLRGEHRRAAFWYRKAALFGHAQAAFNLGLMYYKGDGFEVDYDTALRWIRVAVRSEFPPAQLQLGIMSYHGHGLPQDADKEAYWYRKAAYNGDPDAQYNLAVLHTKGRGVEQNLVLAYMWMLAAHKFGIETSNELEILAENLNQEQIQEAEARFAELAPEIKVKKIAS